MSKTGRPRYIPLSDGVIALLKTVPRKPVIPYVFPNPKTDLPYVSIFNSWNTAREVAGLKDGRMHDLRHSFASFLVNNGRSLYEVQRILGHTQIRTTQRYAHLSQDTLLDAVNMAGDLLEKESFSQTEGWDGKVDLTGKNHNQAKERKIQTKSLE